MADMKALDTALEMAELAATGRLEEWWRALSAAADQQAVVLATSQMLHLMVVNEARRRGLSAQEQYTNLRLEVMDNFSPK